MKSNRNFDEESNDSFYEDDPEDIFNQEFDIYSLDYLSVSKIDQLLDNNKIVCRRYWNFMLNN